MGILPDSFFFDPGNRGLLGMLTMADRWGPVDQAIQGGQFDPQGGNNMPQFGPFAGIPMPQPRPPEAPQEIPQNAMPVQGPIPPGMEPQAPEPMPRWMQPQQEPTVFDRIQSAGAGFFNARSPMESIGNLIGGAITGRRQDAQGSAQDSQNQRQIATYGALRDAGLPHGEAMAAALNPEVLKTVAPQLYGKAKWGVVRENPDGTKTYGFVDENKRTVDVPGGPQNADYAGINSGLTGQDLLATLPPSVANEVKAYVEGRSIPVGNARSPRVQYIKQLAAQYEPGFDETVYKSREATRRDFASGKSAGNVKSLNTVMGHLDELRTAADALNNRAATPWNWLTNNIGDITGKPELKRFNLAREAVANEMAKVFRESGMSEAEVSRWLETFSSSSSPEQFKGTIKTGLGLLESRMDALATQYNRGMQLGPNSQPKTPDSLLDDVAREKIAKINKWIGGVGEKPAQSSGLPRMNSPAEAMKLKSGTRFIDANGVERIRP